MSENGWRRCALFSCPRRKNCQQDSSHLEVPGESCVFSGRRSRRAGGGRPIEKNARDINLCDIQQRDESDRKTRLVDIFPKIIPE